MQRIRLSEYKHTVILTGAGVSADSGIRTFRGPDGLWTDSAIEELAHHSALESRPEDVWAFWGTLRRELTAIEPNVVHRHLASIESDLPATSRLTLITQNVDGLHLKAGSRNVIEIHGRLTRTRCPNDGCSFEPVADDYSYDGTVPVCPICGGNLRIDIVLFGENLGVEAYHAEAALRDADLFVAIGTSGTVYPAAGYVKYANYIGARTVYINLEKINEPEGYFQEQFVGPAEELVPKLLTV